LFDILPATKSNILLFYVAANDVDDTTASVPLTVPVIPGTVSIHQVLCINYGHIKYRDVSCFCSSDKVSCICDVKDFTFIALETNNSFGMSCNTRSEQNDTTKKKQNKSAPPDIWTPVTHLDKTLIGKFCLIKYDGKPFPGKILHVEPDDDDALIECMSRIGDSRFFWPLYRNEAWYMQQDILGIIPEPTSIGSCYSNLVLQWCCIIV